MPFQRAAVPAGAAGTPQAGRGPQFSRAGPRQHRAVGSSKARSPRGYNKGDQRNPGPEHDSLPRGHYPPSRNEIWEEAEFGEPPSCGVALARRSIIGCIVAKPLSEDRPRLEAHRGRDVAEATEHNQFY